MFNTATVYALEVFLKNAFPAVDTNFLLEIITDIIENSYGDDYTGYVEKSLIPAVKRALHTNKSIELRKELIYAPKIAAKMEAALHA